MRKIVDEEELRLAEALSTMAVEDSVYLRESLLDKNGWLVAVVESASHFDKSDIEKIVNATSYIGVSKCYAVGTEPRYEALPTCYEVALNAEGLQEFQNTCSLFSFVLVPKELSFAILCTHADYYLVAGERKFIEITTGNNLLVAHEEFEKFASDTRLDIVTRNHLTYVVKRYRNYAGIGQA